MAKKLNRSRKLLNISFFIAAFSSIFWFIFSLRYINITAVLSGHNADVLYQAVTVMLFPVALIWAVFAIIKSFYAESRALSRINKMLDTLHKNTESTASLCATLLGAEAEIRSGFLISEFDILISDTNEVLADVIKRSNSISSTQMEHLWARTAGGERWLIAKTFIETHNFQSGFANHLLQKAKKDSLLKGSIFEFQTRYQGLKALLETYDKQKLFYNMVEYGALGKVNSLLTPIAQELMNKTSVKHATPADNYNSKSEFAQSEEPLAFPSFFNSDNDKSLFRQPPVATPEPHNDIDNSLKAIRSEILSEPALSTGTTDIPPAPRITEYSNAPSGLRAFKQDFPAPKATATQTSKPLISLDELEKEINASPENNYDEYAYPFGAWINDKSSK